MTTANLLRETITMEEGMTRRILDGVPDDNSAWTPHPKSMPMGRLAMHVATLPGIATVCLSTTDFDLNSYQMPDLIFRSREHMLETFDAGVMESDALLRDATDEQLSELWTLRVGDRVLVQNPRAVILLHMFMGHMIHHRAQLGTYMRLNDIRVPGVYGPSADDKAAATSR